MVSFFTQTNTKIEVKAKYGELWLRFATRVNLKSECQVTVCRLVAQRFKFLVFDFVLLLNLGLPKPYKSLVLAVFFTRRGFSYTRKLLLVVRVKAFEGLYAELFVDKVIFLL